MVLHSTLAGVDNHVPLGVSPYPLTFAAGQATALLWNDSNDEGILTINTVTVGRPGVQFGVNNFGVNMTFMVDDSGSSFSVQDEDFNNLFRLNAGSNWSRLGPGRDVNGQFAVYVDGDRATLVLPRVTTTNRDLISSPEDGMLIYNTTTDVLNVYANGSWTAVGGSGATDLEGLSDVDLTSPATGQILEYNGSQWVNVDNTGTPNTSWEVNDDASAGSNQNPNVVLSGGDGGTDLVQTSLIQDSTLEMLYFTMLRNATGIPAVLGVGGTTTADRDAELRWQGGDGTNRARMRVVYDASANTISLGHEDDNAGGGTFTQNSASFALGRSTGATATTSRSTTVTAYVADGTTERNHSFAFGTGGGLVWTIPAIANALQITDGTNVYIDIDATGVETVNLGNSTSRMWIAIEDNRADAFNVFQGSITYFAADTNNNAEIVTVGDDSGAVTGLLHIEGATANATYLAGRNPAGTDLAGQALELRGGRGTGTGIGGSVSAWVSTIQTGSGTTQSALVERMRIPGGNGSTTFLDGFDAVGTNQQGGFVEINAGAGTGSGSGGSVSVSGGDSSSGAGGSVVLAGGGGTSTPECGVIFMASGYDQNGQGLVYASRSEILSLPSGVSQDTTISVPGDAYILAVTSRVTTAITGPAAWRIGYDDGTTWINTNMNNALGTVGNGVQYTQSNPFSGFNIRVRSEDGTTAFTGGAVRITIHYLRVSAPAS